jgi:hypothetical protein
MKEYLTGALNDGINGFLDNWVQRHAGAGLPQLKNSPVCQCCHRKIPHQPNPPNPEL